MYVMTDHHFQRPESVKFYCNAVKAPQKPIKIYGFCLVQLNTCMKKAETTEIRRVTEGTTNYATDKWLKSVHITPKYLSSTAIDTEFLMAQREAETLQKSFASYLTARQSYQLGDYLKRLSIRKQRETMPISAAYRVLNIAAKINSKLFSVNKKLNKKKNS